MTGRGRSNIHTCSRASWSTILELVREFVLEPVGFIFHDRPKVLRHTYMLKAALRSFSDLSNANLRVYLWAKTSQADGLWTIHTRSHLDFIKKHESVCMFVYVYVWDKHTYTRGYLRHANIHAELSKTYQHTRLAIWDIQTYTLCCLRHTNANALLPETYKYTRLATWDVQTYTPSYLRHTNIHA